MHETTAPIALLITYLGTASFLLDIGGVRILTDPGDLFTGRLTKEKARGIPDVGLVLITHGDFDHWNRLELVPGAVDIPILAPEAMKRKLQGYHVFSDAVFEQGDVRITAFRSIHGMLHDKEHRGYLIEHNGFRICFLGDAYAVDPSAEGTVSDPDVLFVTIGGWESNIQNAMKNIALLRPRKIVPMHWETLWRCDGKARDLADAVRNRFPSVECVVPAYDITVGL